MKVTLNGTEYYQHCTNPNHDCYLRLMPTKINVPIDVLLKNLANAPGEKE